MPGAALRDIAASYEGERMQGEKDASSNGDEEEGIGAPGTRDARQDAGRAPRDARTALLIGATRRFAPASRPSNMRTASQFRRLAPERVRRK